MLGRRLWSEEIQPYPVSQFLAQIPPIYRTLCQSRSVDVPFILVTSYDSLALKQINKGVRNYESGLKLRGSSQRDEGCLEEAYDSHGKSEGEQNGVSAC